MRYHLIVFIYDASSIFPMSLLQGAESKFAHFDNSNSQLLSCELVCNLGLSSLRRKLRLSKQKSKSINFASAPCIGHFRLGERPLIRDKGYFNLFRCCCYSTPPEPPVTPVICCQKQARIKVVYPSNNATSRQLHVTQLL